MVVPYRCRSRRHAGPCETSWRRELYCRIRDGQAGRAAPGDTVFFTWTLARRHHRPLYAEPPEYWTEGQHRAHARRQAQQTALLSQAVSDHLRAVNVVRAERGLPRLRYVWVLEAHKSGVPHAHAMIVNADQAFRLRYCRGDTAELAGEPTPEWLATRPPCIGRVDMSVARNADAVASYLAKLAGEITKGQGHLELGRHQRTYGASRGMLAPRRASHWTGALVTARGAAVTRPRPGSRAADLWRRLTLRCDARGELQGVSLRQSTRPRLVGLPQHKRLSLLQLEAETAAQRADRLEARARARVSLPPRPSSRMRPRGAPTGSRARPVPLGAPAFRPMLC